MGCRRGASRSWGDGQGFEQRWRWLSVWARFALLVVLFARAASAADADLDGLDDEWELTYFGDLSQGPDGDPDGDGLYNQQEEALGSDPTRFDTDGDALSDRRERDLGTDPLLRDTDGDGLTDYAETQVHGTDPLVRDTDGGGRGDGEEVLIDGTDPLERSDDIYDSDGDGVPDYAEILLGTDPFSADSDGDLLSDATEDANGDGRFQGDRNENGIYEPELGDETDPTRADTDGDGLDDGLERLFGTDPFNHDSDADGITDGDEYALRLTVYECLDPAQPDSDFDGVSDGQELDAGLDPCNPDSDGDGVLDAVELFDGTDPSVPASALLDSDGDGLSDNYELNFAGTDPTLADSDGDGLSDAEELFGLTDRYVTEPLDADTDDDGILDGNEGGALVRGAPVGGTSPLDPDSDGDGLTDGQERGLALPEVSVLDPDATDPTLFVPDAEPGSVTDPLAVDTDGDGLEDGYEDRNRDGARQASETDPRIFDTDGDGMDDGWEDRYSTIEHCAPGTTVFLDPVDALDGATDIDGDGLTNLEEYQLVVRVRLELVAARTIPCNADTDADGLGDGREATSSYLDGQTNPTLFDTDGDGLADGLEDANGDGGLTSETETDPTRADTDGDGLADGVEDVNRNGQLDLGETDPRRFDTDGDYLGDGTEVFQFGTDPLVPDSDEDGILDGVEVGLGPAAGFRNVTDPRDPDTDADGLSDGVEDANQDGRFDAGETNPADYDTDDGGVSDGIEVLEDDTDPLEPSDDIVTTGRPNPGGTPPGTPPGEEPEIESRWLLEPNGEIRGSGACTMTRGGRSGMGLGVLALCVGLGLWRRRAGPTRRRALALLPLALLLAGRAVAQTPEQIANARNTNIDVNPHRLNPAGFDLLGTSRPRVLGHLGYRAAVSVQHLAAPAVVADRTSGATLRELVGNREELAVGVALGLFERLQVSALAPIVLHQTAELPGQNLGTATASGFGNLTLVPRAVVVDGSVIKLGVEVPVTLPLWETPAYMGYEGWGVEPRLLSEVMAGPLVFSVAPGVLFKPDQRIFNLEDGDQLTYAIAGQYPDAVPGWDFGVEFQGATPLASPGRSTATRGEALVGARHRFNEQLSVTAGTGAGLMSGIGQSSYRVFLALGYAGSLLATPAAAAPERDCSIKPGEVAPPAGCPPRDTDGDGIPDGADQCPAEAEDVDDFEDADGCPDLDNDGDGIPDTEDGCPLEAEDFDGFKDADGCPEPDNDGDGVLDAADKCPLSPEDKPGPDADGCPERATCPDGAEPTASGQCLAHLEVGLIHIAEPIQFSADTAKLVDSSRQVLDQVVDILDANPQLHVRIVGHTDGEGPAVLNQHLSQLRANSVRWYLLDQSKNPNHLARRLVAIGKGESEPVDSNDSAVGRSRNRRVEFLIVEQAPKAPPAPKKPPAGK